MVTPVTKSASEEARKQMTRAWSSGVATRPSGVRRISAAWASAERRSQWGRMRSDRVRLGAMALTVTPWGPSSKASLRVSAMMPPLAVAYALELDWLTPRPAMDARLTILPAPCLFITGTTAWLSRKVAVRLKWSRACHSSRLSSSSVAAGRLTMVLPPTALIIAREGGTVVGVDVDPVALDRLTADVAGAGGRALALQADALDAAAVEAVS